VALHNPADPDERLQYGDTAGGCIGTYFPSLSQWAFVTNGLAYQHHTDGSAWFRIVSVNVADEDKPLASALLNFYAYRFMEDNPPRM